MEIFFSQWRGIASVGCVSFNAHTEGTLSSCHLILLAGRSEYGPGENKGMLFRNAEA